MSETTESAAVQVHGQRLVARHQNIDSKIELFAANQKRVHDILLHDVWLCLRAVGLPAEVILPLADLRQLVEQEDTAALRLADRLHDPDTANLAELFYEEAVVAWQVERRWEKVETEKRQK